MPFYYLSLNILVLEELPWNGLRVILVEELNKLYAMVFFLQTLTK